MSTQNSLSSLLAQFMRLETNYAEVLSKLSEATTSSSDTVTVTQRKDDGTTSSVLIPSFGFLKSEIARVDRNIQQLAGLGDSSAVVRLPDGTSKKVFESAILRDPTPISSVAVPGTFKIRNNWFFESFLNPLLYVGLDVTGKVPDNMERAVVKRVIANCDTQAKRDYFDQAYRGKNDVDYETFVADMDAEDIQVFVDEDNVDLPLAIVRYKGAFDVLRVSDEDTQVVSSTMTVTVKKRKYKLNRLTYTDVLSGASDTKSVQVNDVLITADGTQYRVDSLDAAELTVVLKRISGIQPVPIGPGVLSVYSPPFKVKEVQVNVGYDERQVVFLKPIDGNFSVAASTFSPGVGFWTNELTIGTPAGTVTLEEFYKSQVVDFGAQFLQGAKERYVPSVYGEAPDAPALDAANFKVVQVNSHKKDTSETDAIKQKLSSKVTIENEIRQLDESINNKKNDLNNNAASKNESERRKLKGDLESLAREKSSKVNLYSSVVKELGTKVRENPAVAEAAKYRVRGFWPVPDPKPSAKTRDQEVVQFKVAYRYLRKDGNAPGTTQLDFVDRNGTTKRGFFSNWTEVVSAVRQRVYNTKTGFYEWAVENVSDPDRVNINQLDVPISKGEKVEIKVKSISEAGWPLNPVESDWSGSIVVDFPNDLQIADESASILGDVGAEESRVKFEEVLNAKGLDLHLQGSFPSGDKYFAHAASDIASEFYTPEGKVINLYEKIKAIDAELKTLRQLVERAKGALSVFLLDEDGNITKITPNYTAKLFAGYYKDLIKSGSGNSITYNHGRVITRSYVLRIENSAASSLELSSYLPGGTSAFADDSASSANNDYKNNRKYDTAPISLSGAVNVPTGTPVHEAPFQSSQVKGQWLYLRARSVGQDEDLYAEGGVVVNGWSPNPWSSGSIPVIPVNGWQVVPFEPGQSGLTHPDVWSGAAAGAGNGTISEFCVHRSHPDITGAYATMNAFKAADAALSGTAYLMTYPKFVHAQYFYDDVTQANGRQQLRRYAPDSITGSGQTAVTEWLNYPPKLGFARNDEWLVGKYSCGAYLFIAPVDHASIAVEGTTELGKRMLEFGEDKGVNIPVIFQFRCSDKVGKVGGWRAGGDITNVTYTKKVGIDIQARNEAPFSFDVEFTCKYEQDSLVSPVYIPNTSLDRLSSIRSQTGRTN